VVKVDPPALARPGTPEANSQDAAEIVDRTADSINGWGSRLAALSKRQAHGLMNAVRQMRGRIDPARPREVARNDPP
jgi:hypothetical protein